MNWSLFSKLLNWCVSCSSLCRSWYWSFASSFLFSLSVLLGVCHFCELYRKPAFWFHWFFSIVVSHFHLIPALLHTLSFLVLAVQLLIRVQLLVTPWTAARQAALSFCLPEFVQTHVHWVSDAIQPSHPLLSPSPFVLDLFQRQGLFQWVGSSLQVTKVLELQLQHQSFQWIFRVDLL